MSNIYITEPPTNGKVLLQTSVGDIDIELWSKETRKTCRNFVQLCMEGYYNGTIFHRVVPEFIVQGGDPTGTGTGGESVYGKPFRDEFHTRLRFVRRGLVAMANAGPNDNGSQFFFTLGATPELNQKHTIFGKVVGDTLYNMLKLAEVEIGPDERPAFPPKINKTKVLSNPYDDIVIRFDKNIEKKVEKESKKSKSKATKNFSLLSFGEEAEEEEVVVKKVNKSMKSKSKSSHDLLDDSKLSSAPAVISKEHDKLMRKKQREEQNLPELTDSSEDEEDVEATKERIRQKLKKPEEKPQKRKDPEPIDSEDDSTKSKTLEELRKEAKRLKRELIASKKPKGKKDDKDEVAEEKDDTPTAPADVDAGLEGFKANRKQYKEQQKKKLKKGSDRESQTLALLAKFQSKLNTARQFSSYGEDEEEKGDGDGESKEGEVEEDGDDVSWMSHKLKFEASGKKVLDANVTDTDRYEIYDPRNPMTQRRVKESKKAMKGSKSKKDDL